MSSYFINCYDQKDKKLNHFKVDYSVYVYIKQLESSIKYKSDSIQNLYPERLKERDINEH